VQPAGLVRRTHEILRCAQDDIFPAGYHPFASLRAGSECSEGSGETDAEILPLRGVYP